MPTHAKHASGPIAASIDDKPTAPIAALREAPASGPLVVDESAPLHAAREPSVPTTSASGAVKLAAAIDAMLDESAPVQADTSAPPRSTKAATSTASEPPVRPSRREAPTVFVVGFWKRLAAAAIDLAIVIPASLLITLLASKIGGVALPPSNIRLLDLDMWIDLVLAGDGAVVMAMVLSLAIGMIYLLVFQILVGRTLGMRVLKLKIIDVYGDRPSPARCLARCGGYLAGVATLFLGFLWMGVDSEKRGLQDWIAGTYVIRA
ncbi:MAG: RDD family protein [Kofleriaceae bacterium]|nr:RDD family protein [Kofleriaceae bacterium]